MQPIDIGNEFFLSIVHRYFDQGRAVGCQCFLQGRLEIRQIFDPRGIGADGGLLLGSDLLRDGFAENPCESPASLF